MGKQDRAGSGRRDDNPAAAELEAAGALDDATDPQPTDAAEDVAGELVTDAPSTAVAVPSVATAELDIKSMSELGRAAVERLNAYLASTFDSQGESDGAIGEIIAGIMAAQTFEEAFSLSSAVGLDDLLDIPIRIFGGKFAESDYEDGPGYFVILDVERLDNGWRGACTTGSAPILAQLMKADVAGWFPIQVKPVYSTKKPTKKGHRPMRLIAA